MLQIAIVDDEPEMRALLRAEVQAACKDCTIEEFASGEALLLSPTAFDLCLLDIKLKGQDGMETARALRQRGMGCAIVFISSYPGYVYQAFDVNAVHYLVKPVDKAQLARVLQKALEQDAAGGNETLLLKQGQNYRKVAFGDIVLLESAGHKLRLHLANGDTLEYYGRIDEAGRALDERFFRCHRAFIVNLDYVSEKSGGAALLPGGLQAPIARKRMKEFTGALLCRLIGDTL